MQAGRFVSGALLAVGLMMAGCGDPSMEGAEEPGAASREALLPDCRGTTAGTIYYSDPAFTAIVGYEGCGCRGRWSRWGVSTSDSLSTDLCVVEP